MDHTNGRVEKYGSKSPHDKMIIERIMLRFRPIAPKPAAGGGVSCSAAEGGSSELVSMVRKKRKYVRVKQTRRRKMDNKKGEKGENLFRFELLERNMSGFGGFNESGSSINIGFEDKQVVPGWMKLDTNFGKNNRFFGGGGAVDQGDRPAEKVVESWMMVEGVSVTSDRWFVEEGGIGITDQERMKNLEMDSCPGLVSDGFDRVQWVNLAYRRLVDPPKDDGGSPAEVVAWLVVKEKLPEVCQAFACTVRVVYPWRNNNGDIDSNNFENNDNKKKYVSQTMPCDVWRMDCGGYAWRLDAKAALSLGR